jgi:hypothetical protein
MADVEDQIRRLIDSGDVGIAWDGPRKMWSYNGKLPEGYSKDAMQAPQYNPQKRGRVTTGDEFRKGWPELRYHKDYADKFKDQDT